MNIIENEHDLIFILIHLITVATVEINDKLSQQRSLCIQTELPFLWLILGKKLVPTTYGIKPSR